MNLSPTWTNDVFGVFFPSLALIHPRVIDLQHISKNANLPVTLVTSSVENIKC